MIKTYFYHSDDEYKNIRVECEPTANLKKGEADNERMETGKSSTLGLKAYLFSWGPPGKTKKIRIIDTPGVGDICGPKQEKKNFAKIFDYISSYKELHTICILMKPNESKLSLTFRYCLNELLAKLHRSASQNILFCFTNARQTLYKPGETRATLESALKKLEEKSGISIPLNNSTMFCFDNEAFRFLCAWREGHNFKDEEIKNFNSSWQHTVTETFRLFERISRLPPHKVSETLSVNNVRSVILAMTRPLADIAKNQIENIRLIDKKIEEVELALQTGQDLKKILYVDQIELIAEALPYPRTVCSADKCIEQVQIIGIDNAPMQTNYKTICHDNCALDGIQTSVYPNPELKKCWLFEKNENICKNCGCPWNTHLHIRYKINKSMKQIKNDEIMVLLDEGVDFVIVAKKFIEVAKSRRDKLEKEATEIRKKCAIFTEYLKKNSIVLYNDVYAEYVEHLIQIQKSAVKQGADEALLKQLTHHKDEYKKEVEAIKTVDSKVTGNNVYSTEEIYQMVHELKTMENDSKFLEKVQKLELKAMKKENEAKEIPVNLEGGWFSSMYSKAVSGVKKTVTAASKLFR